MKPTNSPPVMGLAEAADACGVSVSTIRRKRPELEKLGAARTAKGWHIPVTALIELGLMPAVTEAPPVATVKPTVKGVKTPPVATPPDALSVELEALRAKLVNAEQRAAVAEAVAAERERIIHVQDMALRMLEVGKPPATPATSATPEPVPVIPETAKDGPRPVPLFRRLLGRKL